jgi:hypothetical protein
VKDSQRNELRRLLLFGAAVLVLAFVALVYRSVDHAAFIWDDHTLLEGDAAYRKASVGELMVRSFWPDSPLADARVPYYRPLVLVSYQMDIALGGTPAEFHLTNLFLHLLACLLLLLVAVRAGAGWPRAILAMLGWGVLPRLSEAVAWISGRTDVLAAVFGLGALCLWPEVEAVKRRLEWPRAAFAGLLLFAALLSKEVAIAFGIAMAASVLLRGGTRATLIRAAACIGVPFIAWLSLRTIALAAAPDVEPRALGTGRRIETVFEAIGRYAEMIIDPVHPRTCIGLLGEVDGTRAAVGAVVLCAVSIFLFRYRRWLSFGAKLGLALGVAALVPVLHIVPLSLFGSVTADRLLYVPLAGAAIGFACSLHTRWIAGVTVVFALVCGHATSLRAKTYNEETEFWVIAGERANPNNARPLMSLASHLLRNGEVAPACRLYEKSVAILAKSDGGLTAHRRARESLGGCHARLGLYDQALRESHELVRDYPNNARIELGLGYAELHVRHFDAAGAAFARTSALDPALGYRFGVPPERIAIIRDKDSSFDEMTKAEKAEHLSALGRGPEAAALWVEVARDSSLDDELRRDAVRYLVADGPFAEAEAALIAVPRHELGWDWRLVPAFRRRRITHRALEELEPRVDALAR